MLWTFRMFAALDLVLLAAAFLYRPVGEDPAGAAMRLGFTVVAATMFGVILVIYRLADMRWLRIVVLAVMALPVLALAYGAWLSR
jgi:hypothetical protein